MSQPYWRPKWKPRESGAKANPRIKIADGIQNEWADHAVDAHDWTTDTHDEVPDLLNCAECKRYWARLSDIVK